MTGLDQARVAELRSTIDGVVLTPGDDGYDSARALWNGMIDRRPRLVVACTNHRDVAAAIQSARENDLEIGVRSGGHSIVGHAVPEGGLMIDLRPMNEVRVDPATSHAWIQGGVLLGVLDQAAQPYGLATTAGNVSHTGVGGLTLGGGMGWLARQFGLSCDNLVSSEVVTADGRVVRASATQNPDLFWGLRGGGGNFGVVTEFEFELHPVSDQTLLVELSFPLEEAAAAVRGWRDLNVSAPRQATFTAWVGDVNGEPQVKVGFVWIGPPADGSSLLSAMRALGRPIGERVEELSYLALQQMDDTAEGPALRRYWKGHYFRSLSDDAIEAFIRRGTPDGVGEGLPAASLQAYGGAIADVRDADTAFSHRDTMFEFVTAARWSDPAEDADRTSAARRYAASLEPFASGVYVNSLTDEGNEGVRRAYPPAKLARLVEVKDAWDPENVFHLNHNIAPSRG